MALNFELVVSDQLFSVVLVAYKWFKIQHLLPSMWHLNAIIGWKTTRMSQYPSHNCTTMYAREWKYIIDGQDFRFCILIKFNLKSLYSLILSRMLDVSGRLLIITRQIKQNFWPSKLWWVRLSSPCRFWQALVDQGFRFVTFWNLIVFVDKNLNTTWRKQGASLWL